MKIRSNFWTELIYSNTSKIERNIWTRENWVKKSGCSPKLTNLPVKVEKPRSRKLTKHTHSRIRSTVKAAKSCFKTFLCPGWNLYGCFCSICCESSVSTVIPEAEKFLFEEPKVKCCRRSRAALIRSLSSTFLWKNISYKSEKLHGLDLL